MTRLDYDIDNFSGRYNRGTRYNILLDGEVEYADVSEYEVNDLASQLECKAERLGLGEVEVVEIEW